MSGYLLNAAIKQGRLLKISSLYKRYSYCTEYYSESHQCIYRVASNTHLHSQARNIAWNTAHKSEYPFPFSSRTLWSSVRINTAKPSGMELQIVYAYIYVTCMRTRGCSIKERRGKYLSRVPGYPGELEAFIACMRAYANVIHAFT